MVRDQLYQPMSKYIMQISEMKTRIDQLGNAWEEFKSTHGQKQKEIEKTGSADPITENQLETIGSALDEYKSRLRQLEIRNNRPAVSISTKTNLLDTEYKSAFFDYLKKGNENLISNLSKKHLSGASNSEGGYLVDNAMYQYIDKNITANSIMRQLASRQEISTDSFDILSDDDNFYSGWVSEADARQ